MVEPTPNGQVCSFFNTEYLSSFSAVDDPQFKEHLVPYLISLSSNKSLFSPHIGNNVLPLSLAVDTESNYKALFNLSQKFSYDISFYKLNHYLANLSVDAFMNEFNGLLDGRYLF